MYNQDELRRQAVETLDRLITHKRNDPNWEKWPDGNSSDARKAVYKEILEGFDSLAEAREYIEGMPEDSVIFTTRGDEISFLLIKLVIVDIERTPWLSPFRQPGIEKSRQPPLMPQASPVLLSAMSIPRDDLKRRSALIMPFLSLRWSSTVGKLTFSFLAIAIRNFKSGRYTQKVWK